MEFIIKSDYENKTVKEYIKKELNLSSRILTKVKQKKDGILLNGEHVTVRFPLKIGDILTINCKDDEKDARENNFFANKDLLYLLDIIYEDEEILAVNKPPFMPIHPSKNHYSDTLANIVLAYYENQHISFTFRAVNRLDRDTSGIVLIAKDKLTAYKLNDAMKEGKVRKYYTAFVEGKLSEVNIERENEKLKKINGFFQFCTNTKTGIIHVPIRREEEEKMRRICAYDGDKAETKFELIKEYEKFTEINVFPVTGRTHQIRVHFSQIGFPILCDEIYGNNQNIYLQNLHRQALHSYALEFMHPASKKIIKLKASLPNDLKF